MEKVRKVMEIRKVHLSDGKILCMCVQDGKVFGRIFEAHNVEEANAWERLIVGEYPDSYREAS